ncbi:hypothetical protein AB0D49_40645 [Streptomyces sp. NPDC048290]|uniref:hypothetical protein n=1 Tax=Streptomyces sp. NPDC048290 TaxID=3155811 RepID=UPI003441ADCE
MEREADSGERLDGQLSGRILPGTGSLAGRYTVVSSDATRWVDAGRTASGWSGMSGAGVIVESPQGDLLCGVIREDVRARNGSLLTATPVSVLLADDEFTRIVTERSAWVPLVEPAEPTAILEPAGRLRSVLSPTMLLRADAEVVRFQGREEELRALEGWCEEETGGFSVRVLTGPGGQGKSRLARRLSEGLRAKGWVTGELRGDLRDLASAELESLRTALPFLVVIDYADARPMLVRQVIDHLRSCRHRTRILLLARDDGRWRTDGLAASHADEILARTPVTELAPLAPESGPAGARTGLFDDALVDLSEVLDATADFPGRPPSGWRALAAALRAPGDLDCAAYESVLTLHMTALVTLLQSGKAPVTTPHDEPAEGTLLRHEQRYWVRAGERLAPLPNDTVQRATAVATLCGAADPVEAVAALSALPELCSAETPLVAAWLRTLYPPGPDGYWGAIQPDRVGEYHVGRVLLDFDQPLPLTTLLARCTADQQIRAFTVLVRAATAEHLAGRTARTSRIQKALRDSVDHVDLGMDVLQYLQVAERFSSRGVEDFHLRLAQRLVEACRHEALGGTTAARVRLALALSSLAVSHSRGGRHDAALDAHQQRLRIWRDLDPSHSSRDVQYALALCGSGSYLRSAGRHQEAVRSWAEGIALMEAEARKDPGHLDTLAFQYQGFADMCHSLGLVDDTIKALRRAVAINEALNSARPDEQFTLNLLRGNLVASLASAGRLNEASHVGADLVEGHRLAALRNPYRDEPLLISALSGLGNLQKQLGRYEEACHALREAVGIAQRRKSLGIDTSDTNNGIVRDTLQLGICQADDGRMPEFLESLRHALDAWHQLDDTPPDHDHAAALLLSRAVSVLVDAGMLRAALEPALAALLHTYRLVCRDPKEHLGEQFRLSEIMNRINQHADNSWYEEIPRIEELWDRLTPLKLAAEESAREEILAGILKGKLRADL